MALGTWVREHWKPLVATVLIVAVLPVTTTMLRLTLYGLYVGLVFFACRQLLKRKRRK